MRSVPTGLDSAHGNFVVSNRQKAAPSKPVKKCTLVSQCVYRTTSISALPEAGRQLLRRALTSRLPAEVMITAAGRTCWI
jgi:hypothetical protein